MRTMMPAASIRRNRFSGEVAAAAASMMLAAMPRNTAGSGCTTARLSIQGSRGRTQQIAAASTPWASSHRQASVAVLPEPTTTYWLDARSRPTRALTGITLAPAATSNGGGVSAGMVGARYRASTIRHCGGTVNRCPEMRERIRRSGV